MDKTNSVLSSSKSLTSKTDLRKIKRRAKSKLDSRRGVIVLFGLTVLAIGLVLLQTQFPDFWQRWRQPLILSSLPDEQKFDPQPVLDEINFLTSDLRGSYGVYVYQLTSGQHYGIYQDEVFPIASLVKLPAILTLYQQAEKGELDLRQQYVLKAEDKVGGAGILQAKTAGEAFTWRQLAQYMGQYSDNTAYHIVAQMLGLANIQQTATNLGMTKTNLAQYESSPQDIGLFFQLLYQGKLVSQTSRAEIYDLLTETAFEDRIPAGVPSGVQVIHKVGTEIGNFSDAGIVMAPEPFVLVIISKGARESEAIEILPRIAGAVWQFEVVDKE